ncbi:DUF6695 family protein [Sphingobacterium paucimobilis]|uniref:Uncharacterized protein n=1 Tax=Sphingobacterium paucimobilis HER1398 TaxID=1346330 RepID=U2H6I5_9SPHI|nr:DUF6695 family protein [Sphingobacterium paucimobilis]ERJ57316.1 hypothetical protein M472_00915 [Sphingobacterium paucimobilis HER1398]
MISFNDFAIPLAWPDKTAFGDERWMAFLKKCGIVKNLNFKVGHAALLLISRHTGAIDYYDFGRYVTPRGDGRARSKVFDPRLKIDTVAQFSSGNISNLDHILRNLSAIEEATHGGGRLLFSIVNNISYITCRKFADSLVAKGPIPYGAFAAGNNSCSRFVAQVLIAGMPPNDPRIRRLKYPETLKPSPVSNIVNTRNGGFVHCYENGDLQRWKSNRFHSLKFHWQLLKENLSHSHFETLGCDIGNGQLDNPSRPPHLQDNAQWLGGIGEGMWFQILPIPHPLCYLIESYNAQGQLINQVNTLCPQDTFDIQKDFEITRQMDGAYFTIIQNGMKHLFKKTENKYYKKYLNVI